MTTNAISGVGTTFGRENDASSGVYTNLAEVNRIEGPSMTREFIDVTSLDSTGGYREYIGGFRDPGTVELDMNFTIDGFNTMKDDFESSSAVGYQIVLPDTGATTLQFDGFVTELPLSIVPDDKVTMSITIKITGQVDLTT